MNLPIDNLRKRYNCQVPSTFSFEVSGAMDKHMTGTIIKTNL